MDDIFAELNLREQIRELHVQVFVNGVKSVNGVCEECGAGWPCPTERLVARSLVGEPNE